MRFWCKFGAILYATILTISHVFPRYSRYQTVFLKLQEINYYFFGSHSKITALTFVGAVFYVRIISYPTVDIVHYVGRWLAVAVIIGPSGTPVPTK